MVELPEPSTALAADPVLAFDGRRLEVVFEFAGTDGPVKHRLVFEQARAFRFVAEPYCEPWHYELAYDRVAEASSSSWLDEIEGRSAPASPAGRHFAITVDSWGCLEVLAAGAELLPAA